MSKGVERLRQILNETLDNIVNRISDEQAREYGIPPWALQFDGYNAPEGGVFLRGNYEVGQVVNNPYPGPEKVVVIFTLRDGRSIATKAHNLRPY